MYKDYQCCKVMNLCRNKQIKYDILTLLHCFFGIHKFGTAFANKRANAFGKSESKRENNAAQPQTNKNINK